MVKTSELRGSASWSGMVDPKNLPVQNVKRCVLSSNCIMYTMVQNQILSNHVMNKRCSKLNQFAPPLPPFPLLVLSVLCLKGLFSHKLIQVRPSPWMFPKEESSGINSVSSCQLNVLHVSISELKERGWYIIDPEHFIDILSEYHSLVSCVQKDSMHRSLSDKTSKIVNKLYVPPWTFIIIIIIIIIRAFCKAHNVSIRAESEVHTVFTQWNENGSRQMAHTLLNRIKS